MSCADHGRRRRLAVSLLLLAGCLGVPGTPEALAGGRLDLERFAQAGVPASNISFARDTWLFNYPGPPSALLAEFRTYYGPTMNAFDSAASSGRADVLQAELETLFNSQNKSLDKDKTSIPATFLRVTVAV